MEAFSNLEFSELIKVYPSAIALMLLIIIVVKYLRKQPEAPKGLELLMGGFFSLIIAHTMPFARLFSYSDIITFFELVFVCLASVMFLTAGLMLKRVRAATEALAYVFFALTLFLAVYLIFILKAPHLTVLLYYLSLSLGYFFLGVGFASQSNKKQNYGFVLTSLVFFLLAVYNVLMITGWGRATIGSSDIVFAMYFIISITLLLCGDNLLNFKIQTLEDEVQANQSRLRLIIQSSPFPIIISRLRDDRLMLVNQKAQDFLNIDTSRLTNYRLGDFFADASFKTELMARLEKSSEIEDFEVVFKSQSGMDEAETWVQLSTHVIDFEYEIALYSAVQDITERKRKEQELFNEATRDSLTNAYTRRFFEELANKEIMRSIRYARPFCVLMIDADHFKNVNDTYGHAVGDKVLKELVITCGKILRKSDIVSRFGGEEFVVLLPEISLANAQIVADRLRVAISEAVVQGEKGEEVRFTVSIGLVPSSYSTDLHTLIKASDEALYVAKNSGRNRVISLTPQEDGDALAEAAALVAGDNPIPAVEGNNPAAPMASVATAPDDDEDIFA
ncbi:MAG: GGDEF domain-containing protein [Alphaproteobacteria bacterium]|nr:GGDEF domain-containing protein [Alphaproteobacteria bacterium]